MELRPDETLLLAGERDEDQRRVELDPALGERPSQLHRQGRATAIVVDAGRPSVGVVPVERRRSGLPGHGVVVSADVEAPG